MFISNYKYLNSDISNQKTYRIEMRMRINLPSVVMLLYSSLKSASVSIGAHNIFESKMLKLLKCFKQISQIVNHYRYCNVKVFFHVL